MSAAERVGWANITRWAVSERHRLQRHEQSLAEREAAVTRREALFAEMDDAAVASAARRLVERHHQAGVSLSATAAVNAVRSALQPGAAASMFAGAAAPSTLDNAEVARRARALMEQQRQNGGRLSVAAAVDAVRASRTG